MRLIKVYFFMQELFKLSKVILNDAKRILVLLPSAKLSLKNIFLIKVICRKSIFLNFSLVSLFTCVHQKQKNPLVTGPL